MNKYRFKGKVITASSKREAIKIFAKKKVVAKATKVTASSKLDDDVYEDYGNDFLLESRNGDSDYAIHNMDELDEELGSRSPSEAIMDAWNGSDFDGENHNGTGHFNPNEDYFSYTGDGNLISIRGVYIAEWLRGSIDEHYFIEWLKGEHPEAIEDLLKDEVEAEINKVRSTGKMFGFDSKELGYDEVTYDRDDNTLNWQDVTVDYDFDWDLDSNLENLRDAILDEHPNAFDEDEDEE